MKRRSPKKDMIKKQIEYWKESADRNWKIAHDMFRLKHYDACLFFCHLTIEKLLKSLILIKTKTPAPFAHDLSYLAKIAKLNSTTKQDQELRQITSFNIAGRYSDDKFEFYKKYTKPFAQRHLEITNQLRLWLEKQFPKK